MEIVSGLSEGDMVAVTADATGAGESDLISLGAASSPQAAARAADSRAAAHERGSRPGTSTDLTAQAAEDLEASELIPDVASVAPVATTTATAVWEGSEYDIGSVVGTDEDYLAAANLPPMADDLHEALAVQRRPRTDKATKWLLAAVLIAGGFIGGVAAQQQWGTAETGFEPGGGLGAFPEGAGAELPVDGEAGVEETTGTVVMVDGTTVYIETDDGTTVIVETTEDTQVRSAQAAELADLAEGDQVTVTGQAGEEDTVSADDVTEIVE